MFIGILENREARRNLAIFRKVELTQRRDKFLNMAEEGKRNIRKGAEITHNKVWGTPTEVLPLSTSDKGNEESLNTNPTESVSSEPKPTKEPSTSDNLNVKTQTSEPKVKSPKPEPNKPERINVQKARAKELGVSTGMIAKHDHDMSLIKPIWDHGSAIIRQFLENYKTTKPLK